jgi:hypothetical protein
MQYQGIVFDLYHDNGKPLWEDPAPAVKATLTERSLSIDYKESGGSSIHVEATSGDGIRYSGRWGCPALDPRCPVEFQVFESRNKSDNEVVLIGTWEDKETYREGCYIFRLWPSKKNEARKNQ